MNFKEYKKYINSLDIDENSSVYLYTDEESYHKLDEEDLQVGLVDREIVLMIGY